MSVAEPPGENHPPLRMPYIVERTKLLTETFERMSRLPPHRLAGHAANVDYWRSELHCTTESIDSYSNRFRRMKEATNEYLRTSPVADPDLPLHLHHIHALKPDTRTTPAVRDSELRELKRALRAAASQFTEACVRSEMLSPEQADAFLEGVS